MLIIRLYCIATHPPDTNNVGMAIVFLTRVIPCPVSQEIDDVVGLGTIRGCYSLSYCYDNGPDSVCVLIAV